MSLLETGLNRYVPRVVLLIALAFTVGCFEPHFGNHPACGGVNDQDCPAGLKCALSSGVCVQTGCADVVDGEPCVGDVVADGVCHNSICIPRGCGDGKQDTAATPPEACDDGNNRSGDGCSADCQSTEECGNGILDPREQCDFAAPNQPAGQCRSDCTSRLCGDGIVDDDNNEKCDEGMANAETPNAPCRTNCQFKRCGDGIVDSGEACDEGDIVSGDGCSGDCLSLEVCGNSYVDFTVGEQCDSGIKGFSGDGCSSVCQLEIPEWTEISPRQTPKIPSRSGFMVAAYDSRRNRLLALFNNTNKLSQEIVDTWTFDGTNWMKLSPINSPPPKAVAAMVFDNVIGRAVVFGSDGAPGAESQTWEFDGVNWIQLHPPVQPPPRRTTVMAFNSATGKTVLFGGHSPLDSFLDTWEFDGRTGTWTPFLTAAPPTIEQFFPAMAFDSRRQVLVLTGGDSSGTTWEFVEGSWIARHTLHHPGARPGGQMTFDSQTGQIVLYGGQVDSESSAELWTYDGNDWTLRSGDGVVPPPPVQGGEGFFPMATLNFNPELGLSMLLQVSDTRDCCQIDTYELDSHIDQIAGWSKVSIPTFSASRASAAAFDIFRGRLVTIVPNNTVETWEFDGVNWLHQPDFAGPFRQAANLAFASSLRKTVLFGGGNGPTEFADTWTYDGVTWLEVTPLSSPPARTSPAMCESADGIMLFGGETHGVRLSDTWQFDGLHWVQLFPAHAPDPRILPAMTFDPVRNKVVLFGGLLAGTFGDQLRNDTWEFDGVDWTQIVTAHAPRGRSSAMSYDRALNRIILTAGFDTNGVQFNDTWEYDGQDWVQIATSQVPIARGAHRVVYDSVQNRLIMFGGFAVANQELFDTWTFGFSSAANPPDRCVAGVDSDGDGLVACGDSLHDADPDCAGRCQPACPASNISTPCDTGAPHCGDGSCGLLEDYLLCPADCAVP